MGTAVSLLWPPRPPQESERGREMELRKRPRPVRVDPDFVMYSPPPPEPLRKRPRKQAAPRKPRAAAPPPRKTRCAGIGLQSPVAGLQPSRCCRQAAPVSRHQRPRVSSSIVRPRRPFRWYEVDLWTEVAKYLHGWDLVRLTFTCRWFFGLLADDTIWRFAFIRDLSLPVEGVALYPPRPFHSPWRLLYAAAFDDTHAYCFRQREKHIEWFRIGGFLLDTPSVLMSAMLSLPPWLPLLDSQEVIQLTGACELSNARPGIWIADFNLVRCPMCNIKTCSGTMQVLDTRHCELYLEPSFRDGTWEYEDLGEHFADQEAIAAACAIFNRSNLSSDYSHACVLDAKSWIRKRDDLLPKACIRPYAVALNTNLQPNQGLLTKFQAMRDPMRDGQIVSVRITQQLF